MRLDKYLADMGAGTRSEVKNLIKKGFVTVNEISCKNADQKVTESDQIAVRGMIISYISKEYYMLYKPAGVLSATRDKYEKTVLDLINTKKRKDLFPVGRLDKDTEGLLLITNDGDLAHSLLSPRKHIGKVYFVRLNGEITKEQIYLLETGIKLEDGVRTQPASLKVLNKNEGISEVEITIYEGKFHQVKRMFLSVGLEVIYLKRLSMGNLVLDETLRKGEYRVLTEKELADLKEITKERIKNGSDI